MRKQSNTERKPYESTSTKESTGPVGIITPISPPSLSTDCKDVTEIRRYVERIAWGIRIETPLWGPDGRLWIPFRDAHLEEELRRILEAHGFTDFKHTVKLGKVGRKNRIVFLKCQPPGNAGSAGSEGQQASAENVVGDSDRGARRLFVVQPILDQKGWSGLDWALNAKVDYHTVDNYLDGKTNPFTSTRKKLAESLELRPEQLPQ